MRKKSWVNPNPTRCNHPGCMVTRQSNLDKKKYLESLQSQKEHR